MEKALVKVGSIKAGGFWLTKKAKEEINNITDDLNVSKLFFPSISLLFLAFLVLFLLILLVCFPLFGILEACWAFFLKMFVYFGESQKILTIFCIWLSNTHERIRGFFISRREC